MRTLFIRQPISGGTEQILRGPRNTKTIEYRSRPTNIIGERFYIYASRKWAGVNGHDAEGIKEGEAPTGVIVGSAKISRCVRNNGHYEWHLSGVKRLKKPRTVKGQPQPVWFRPW